MSTFWHVMRQVILLSHNETEVPSWFASLAIKYKKGKDKTAAFAHVTEQVRLGSGLRLRLRLRLRLG